MAFLPTEEQAADESRLLEERQEERATTMKLVARADEIGAEWEAFKENLAWPASNPFYLYDDNGNAVQGYTNAHCRIEWMDY